MILLKPKDLPKAYSVPKTVISYQPQSSAIHKIEYRPVEIVSAPIVSGHLQRPQSHVILHSGSNHVLQNPVVKQSQNIQKSIVP